MTRTSHVYGTPEYEATVARVGVLLDEMYDRAMARDHTTGRGETMAGSLIFDHTTGGTVRVGIRRPGITQWFESVEDLLDTVRSWHAVEMSAPVIDGSPRRTENQ